MERYKRKFIPIEFFEYYKLINSFHNKKLKESLQTFAYDQLQQAGLFDKDSDYEGLLGKAIFELIQCFCKQGHSGYSAPFVNTIFNKLANYEPINEIKNPMLYNEYEDISSMSCVEKNTMLQSTIIPNLFSSNGGKTWYLILDKFYKDENGITYSKPYEQYIDKFPFKYEDYIKI